MDKDTLFTSVLPEEDVILPGKGAVRVRSLTRAELHESGKDTTNGKNPNHARDAEIRMVCYGLVDPVLNINEVKEWAKVAASGEFQKVVKAIMRLSSVSGNDEEGEEEVANAMNEAYDDFR